MDPIHVTLPAHPAMVRVIRSVANRAADLAGLGFDRVEDLGLAVDEAASALLVSGGNGPLRAVVDQAPGLVKVRLSVEDGVDVWPPVDFDDSITGMVLYSVADVVEFASSSEATSIELSISAQPL